MSRCTTCGNQLGFYDLMRKKCETCHQIESKLEEYIQSKKGRRFVAETLINTKAGYQCKLKARTLNKNGICGFIKDCSVIEILNCPRGFGKCQ